MINGGQMNVWGLIGRSSDQAQAFLAGVRSPPLRVRVARPCASPGYAMITEGRTNGRWPNREMLRSRARLSRGRAEPAPPGDWSPELG
jgi:hypothetical protein